MWPNSRLRKGLHLDGIPRVNCTLLAYPCLQLLLLFTLSAPYRILKGLDGSLRWWSCSWKRAFLCAHNIEPLSTLYYSCVLTCTACYSLTVQESGEGISVWVTESWMILNYNQGQGVAQRGLAYYTTLTKRPESTFKCDSNVFLNFRCANNVDALLFIIVHFCERPTLDPYNSINVF